ncbi:MAG TPA: outer membrane beta-barrel protein, partial [Stellaceae bacterium]|nr:outer membrane beta-barrel protein [Stellaceae bacterium]
AGEFFFFPRFEVDEAYDDNIFATASNTIGDFINILAPSFDVLSNFPTNAINLHAGARIGNYASHTSENYQDGFGAADGRLDVDAIHQIYGGVRAEQLHEDRAAPDAPGNAAEPVKYDALTANVGAAQVGLRVGLQADGVVRREIYHSVPLIGGGILNQSDRNETSYEGALKASYEFIPNYQAYVRGAFNDRVYDDSNNGDPLNPNRNSQGYRIDVGTRINLTGVTYADAYVGYLAQDYNSNALASITGFDFGAGVVWNVTQLTTIQLKSERNVQDANTQLLNSLGVSVNSPGYLHTTAAASVDHELLRNVLLNGKVGYFNDNFVGISRTDQTYTAGVGVKYLINRYLYVGATYDFSHRESSGGAATTPYTRDIIMLRVSTQL